MVALSVGNKSGDHTVSRRVLVVERSLSEPVRKRVDTEGGLKGKSGENRSANERTTRNRMCFN